MSLKKQSSLQKGVDVRLQVRRYTPSSVRPAISTGLKGAMIFALVSIFGFTHPARAAVSLLLNPTGSTATAVTVTAGQTLNVNLKVTSTAEQLTGVDYYLQINVAASGHVRIANRDTSASPFGDPSKANNGDNSANPGVLDSNFSLLNPRNGLDLGATLSNISAALPPNTGSNPASYLLATYSLAVDSTTPPGNYTLATSSFAGSGVVTQSPSFVEESFSQQAALSLTVVPATLAPEPAGVMVVLGAVGFALRRRSRLFRCQKFRRDRIGDIQPRCAQSESIPIYQ